MSEDKLVGIFCISLGLLGCCLVMFMIFHLQENSTDFFGRSKADKMCLAKCNADANEFSNIINELFTGTYDCGYYKHVSGKFEEGLYTSQSKEFVKVCEATFKRW